jgi:hypothetical protein
MKTEETLQKQKHCGRKSEPEFVELGEFLEARDRLRLLAGESISEPLLTLDF